MPPPPRNGLRAGGAAQAPGRRSTLALLAPGVRAPAATAIVRPTWARTTRARLAPAWLGPARLALAVLALAGGTALAAPAGASMQSQAGAAGPPARLVSLAPALTESLFDIGAGGSIVGTIDFSDRPPEAADIPRVGSHAGLDYERIVALRPSHVIAWGGGTPERWLDRLRTLGLRVEIVQVSTLADIADSLLALGRISGHDTRARERADEVRARLATLAGRRDAARPPWRVFYQIWPDPLMTINGRHVISDAIRRCGGRNLFEDRQALVPRVGVEDVLSARPQFIVAARAPGEADPLVRWRRFETLPAVRDDRLLLLDADRMSRPTTAMLAAVERLCAALAG